MTYGKGYFQDDRARRGNYGSPYDGKNATYVKEEMKMGYLGIKIQTQWKAARPGMVAALEKAGILREAVDWADNRAVDTMVWLMRRGTPWWSAEETALAEWMFPTEQEQATLTPDQMPFLPSE